MATKNPRVNVVMEESTYRILKDIAGREKVSLSSKARDLIKEAIAEYEDAFWSEKAAERERTFSRRKALRHQSLWKKS
jgi:hypothetical protein